MSKRVQRPVSMRMLCSGWRMKLRVRFSLDNLKPDDNMLFKKPGPMIGPGCKYCIILLFWFLLHLQRQRRLLSRQPHLLPQISQRQG